MEEYSRTLSTKSTGFYGFNHKLQHNYAPLGIPTYSSPIKPQYVVSDYGKDRCSQVATKVSTMVNEIEKLKELNKKVCHDTNFEQTQQQNRVKLTDVFNANKEVENDIKEKINEITNNTEKQIEELFGRRTQFFKESDRSIKGYVSDLKELKNKYLAESSNQYHNKLQQIKNKANTLKKQAVMLKKQKRDLKKEIFEMLSTARVKLHIQVDQQQIQRNICNKTVQNLLEVSCIKAEQALRRKLY